MFQPLTAKPPAVTDAPYSGALTLDLTQSTSDGVSLTHGSTPAASRLPASPTAAPNENLGSQMIEGLLTDGTRVTVSYPTGTFDHDHRTTSVTDIWRSRDLKTTLIMKTTSPTTETVSRLTDINRTESDPALFAVPADYAIVDEAGRFTIKY